MGALSVEGATRRYPARGRAGPVAALGPLDLRVAEGEFVAVVGPSGCGKSTLLRLIAGLEAPDEGAVRVGGAPVDGPAAACGMVFQHFALFPWLTVRGNVGFGLRGRPARERAEAVDRWLAAVGLSGFADHYPASLSGGMRQRAALARALAPGPGVLLLDEPFGALDQQTRGLMQEMLEGLWRRERRTVLLVTHDIDEALFLADRVVALSARPGRALRAFAADFGRPRDPRARSAPGFAALKGEIAEALRAEALSGFDPGAAPGP